MEVRVSDAIETLLAPALLPRGGFNHQLLLWLRELELRFPLLGAGAPPRDETPGVSDAATEREGAPVGKYEVSYVDDDVLVGRANRLGTFVQASGTDRGRRERWDGSERNVAGTERAQRGARSVKVPATFLRRGGGGRVAITMATRSGFVDGGNTGRTGHRRKEKERSVGWRVRKSANVSFRTTRSVPIGFGISDPRDAPTAMFPRILRGPKRERRVRSRESKTSAESLSGRGANRGRGAFFV